MSTMPGSEALVELHEHGLIAPRGDTFRTTARWQAAMARAALRLVTDGTDDGRDLRVRVVLALLDFFHDASDAQLCVLADTLVPIELAALEPRPAVSTP